METISLEAKISQLLIKHKKKLAVAESCTGGLISHYLTNIPGSSNFFLLGVVAYDPKAKIYLLKVPQKIIKIKGTVSSEVAKYMAKGILKLANADISIGLTGIAGPSGGTKESPVGTVYIAVASQFKLSCKKFYFKGNRQTIKRKASRAALSFLKRCLN